MVYIASNVVVLLLVVVFEVMFLDAYIKKLVDEAVERRCGNCEFKKSKIAESQSEAAISEF